ncbi:MAG TPA: molybdopterin molybdenumtransferase MoeA [Deltaproteobacteria bacterium]|nr:molybdopterin molybdenumtransferase MoeA [Deltaproteobacteria bacterium]
MITVKQARDIILGSIAALPQELVCLEDAIGRYLSTDIISNIDIPPWDNSAMDGYAVHCADIDDTGKQLKIAYELPAGTTPKGPFGKDQAVRIMTGAPVPPGTDAVIMREHTSEQDTYIIIDKLPKPHQHIRLKGEDIKNGDLVLRKGIRIGPAQIGILASLRRILVPCHQRPAVAILATGDEIADLDEELSQGKISSSNSYTLISLVKELGGIPIYLGVARDNREDLVEKLSQAKKADLILTSGGVSMGDYDIVKEVMSQGGNAMDFWKVEMKPGKPLAFGKISDIPAIGLPGNPVSTMTSFYQFARPAILKLMGANNLLLPAVSAKLVSEIKSTGDRPEYLRGLIEKNGPELTVTPAGPQGSGILSSLSRANCFILVSKGTTIVHKGKLIDCEIFEGTW